MKPDNYPHKDRPALYGKENRQLKNHVAESPDVANSYITKPAITAGRTDKEVNKGTDSKPDHTTPDESANRQPHLSFAQQQFVLRFCNQLASVIQACDQSESAEIEVGRRLVGTQSVKVKLRAEREN